MKLKIINFITGDGSAKLNNYLMKLTKNSNGIFQNCLFHFNSEIKEYDYLVVFETLTKKIKLNKNTVSIYIAGESTAIKKYDQKFLDQFDHIITCQKRIKHKSVYYRSPGHTWFSDKTYDELLNIRNIKKEKLLSIVVSNKTSTKGHRDRLKFCLKLKDTLGDKVDLFGRGFKDFNDKWEVIAPYKYSIAIENSIEDDWITEKLGDCYTSLTFPFYMGAPNVSEYYNQNSYELIDIRDFEGSLKRILDTVNDDTHYKKHLQYLIDAKYDYLNKHSMIPMVCSFIDKLKPNNQNNKTKIIFPNKTNFTYKIKYKIYGYIRRFV